MKHVFWTLHLDLANFSLEYVAASKCYRIVLRKILLDDPNAASLLFAVLDTLTPLSLFSSHQNLCIHLIQCLSEARKHGTYATLSSLAPDFAAYLAPYLPVFLLVWSRWDYSSWPFRKWSAFSGCTKKQLRLKQFCSDAERIEHRDTLWHTQRYRADLYEACLKRWTILDRNFNDISHRIHVCYIW